MIDAESMLLAALLIATLLCCVQIAMLVRTIYWWPRIKPGEQVEHHRSQRKEGGE